MPTPAPHVDRLIDGYPHLLRLRGRGHVKVLRAVSRVGGYRATEWYFWTFVWKPRPTRPAE